MSNIRDALIAEMLGDVGKLHDEVKALPEALQPITNNFTGRAVQLQAAADRLVDILRQMVAQADTIASSMLNSAAQRDGSPVDHALIERIASVVRTVVSREAALQKLQAEQEAGQKKKAIASAGDLWVVVVAATGCSVVGGIAAALGVYLLLT